MNSDSWLASDTDQVAERERFLEPPFQAVLRLVGAVAFKGNGHIADITLLVAVSNLERVHLDCFPCFFLIEYRKI